MNGYVCVDMVVLEDFYVVKENVDFYMRLIVYGKFWLGFWLGN